MIKIKQFSLAFFFFLLFSLISGIIAKITAQKLIREIQEIKEEIAIPICDTSYHYSFYNPIFISSDSIFATKEIDGVEFVHKFHFGYKFVDDGDVVGDSGVAIAGQINGRPYLYLQYLQDVVPGYPDEENTYIFNSYTVNEKFVSGTPGNLYIIAKPEGRRSLDVCRVKKRFGSQVYIPIKELSDPTLDENGIYFIQDSIYLSRKDTITGFYNLYKSVRSYTRNGKEKWSKLRKMPEPYNKDSCNSMYFFWFEGIKYISRDNGNGVFKIYAIAEISKLVEKFGNKKLEEEIASKHNNDSVLSSLYEEYKHNLYMRFRDTTYAVFVTTDGYGFYNTTVDLVDDMRGLNNGDTIYVLDSVDDLKNIVEDKLTVIGTVHGDSLMGAIFMLIDSTGTKFTAFNTEFVKKTGLTVSKNLLRKNNVSEKDSRLLNLDKVDYALYKHSLIDPKVTVVKKDKVEDKIEDKTEDEYKFNLCIKIRGNRYEESVTPDGYTFYNSNVDLTDDLHKDEKVDTVYVLDDIKDVSNDNLDIVAILMSKKSIEYKNNMFMAKNKKGEKFTIIPIDIAREAGLDIKNKLNMVTRQNVSEKSFYKLADTQYFAYSHTMVNPDLFRKTKAIKNSLELNDYIKHHHELTKQDVLDLFTTNDTCFVQVGFYTNKQPSRLFWSIFNKDYTVMYSDRRINGRKVGTQYTINLPLLSSLDALEYTISGFRQNNIKDDPFIRIGKWSENYVLIKLLNGNYSVKRY